MISTAPTANATTGPAGDSAVIRSAEIGPVLVLDDMAEVAEAVAELCRGFGAQAVTSTRGDTVGAMLSRHRPGGLIVDLMMPDQDGFEVLRDVAAFDSRLPVLLMTGHGGTWLRMGAAFGRAHGLTEVSTARKPIRGAAIAGFLEMLTRRAAPGR